MLVVGKETIRSQQNSYERVYSSFQTCLRGEEILKRYAQDGTERAMFTSALPRQDKTSRPSHSHRERKNHDLEIRKLASSNPQITSDG